MHAHLQARVCLRGSQCGRQAHTHTCVPVCVCVWPATHVCMPDPQRCWSCLVFGNNICADFQSLWIHRLASEVTTDAPDTQPSMAPWGHTCIMITCLGASQVALVVKKKKKPAYQYRRHKRHRFWSLGWEDPLEEGTAVLLPGDSYGQRSLVDYSLWGRKEPEMTELT